MFKEIILHHNDYLNNTSNIRESFNFKTPDTSKIEVYIYLVNNKNDNTSIDLFDYNSIRFVYNDNVITSLIDINKNNTSSNLDKIGTNETNISSNLDKIDTNETNISSNLDKIGTNETNISSNLDKIGTNETNISSNLDKIGTNGTNVSSNLDKIGTNEANISSNLISINYNEDNIAYNLSEIVNIKNNISKSYLKNIYNILFYDKKTQIDFRNIFFNKSYEMNCKKMIL